VKGSEPSFIEYTLRGQAEKEVTPIRSHRKAASLVAEFVKNRGIRVDCIGHRFVHGGSYFSRSAVVNEDTLHLLRLCLPLAPIHNSISLSVISECRKSFPDVRQYVTFDSAFHSSLPDYAYEYALPRRVVEKFGFRKYGFHGLSYTYVTREAARFLNAPLDALRIVACHLGTGGSSVAAVRNGRSVDTSMGYSPLPGLVMSTRSGDIDPMLTLYFMSLYGVRPDDLMDILNKKSGLLGISEFSSDIRDIIHRVSESGAEQAELAFNMYVHRLKKYVGSYIAVLGGIDVLIFTDDIGLRNPLVREKVCEEMEWCGIVLDKDANRLAVGNELSVLSASDSMAKVLAIPTDEEVVIATEGMELLGRERNAAAF
jgi:acetate kinase